MSLAGGGGVDAMRRTIGGIALGLSACGYPLTRFAVCRGAAVAEAACAGLAIRDASLAASGVPRRLRAVPGALLHLELAAAIVASLAGLRPLGTRSAAQASSARAAAADAVRRTAGATLFAVHTIRFGIYLRPDQGRRAPPTDAFPAMPGCAGRQPR